MIITVVQGQKSWFGFNEPTLTNLVDDHIINKGKYTYEDYIYLYTHMRICKYIHIYLYVYIYIHIIYNLSICIYIDI